MPDTRERELALKLLVSATQAEAIRPKLGLPDNMAGLTIVDLAAGASTLTANLLTQRANAYALDYVYDDREQLIEAVYNKWLPKVLSLSSDRAERQFVEDVTKRSIRRFLRSFEAQRQRYKAGWLTDLPFESDFSDWTVSYSGVSELFEEPDLLKQATMEAVRITKPGGIISIAPFITNSGSSGIGGRITRTHNELVIFLSEQNVGQVTVDRNASTTPDSRLRIVKA